MTALTEAFVPLTSLMDTMRNESFETLDTQTATLAEPAIDSAAEPSIQTHEEAAEVSDEKQAIEEVSSHACNEPKVLIDRDGDRITHIRLLCCCGQSIVVDCQYPEPAVETASEQAGPSSPSA